MTISVIFSTYKLKPLSDEDMCVVLDNLEEKFKQKLQYAARNIGFNLKMGGQWSNLNSPLFYIILNPCKSCADTPKRTSLCLEPPKRQCWLKMMNKTKRSESLETI